MTIYESELSTHDILHQAIALMKKVGYAKNEFVDKTGASCISGLLIRTIVGKRDPNLLNYGENEFDFFKQMYESKSFKKAAQYVVSANGLWTDYPELIFTQVGDTLAAWNNRKATSEADIVNALETAALYVPPKVDEE